MVLCVSPGDYLPTFQKRIWPTVREGLSPRGGGDVLTLFGNPREKTFLELALLRGEEPFPATPHWLEYPDCNEKQEWKQLPGMRLWTLIQ